MHSAQRWSGAFLLKSMDTNRTVYAKRKASRGIRLATVRGVTVVARSVRGEVLAVTVHAIERFSR